MRRDDDYKYGNGYSKEYKSFEFFWKEFGRLHEEVLKHPDIEQDFYRLAKWVWNESRYNNQ